MKVPFLDLKAPHAELRKELDAAYSRVLDAGWFILGEETDRFEAEFARFCGTEFCIGVGNGLDALHLALIAHGIGKGDEVIVPSNTYIATWLAISYAGGIPIPVEPDSASYNLDPAAIEAAITPRTRAILPVHLYGRIADMAAICAVAEKHGLVVIEDCAQSHGARQNSKAAGAWGHSAAWSFYPGKNLGALGDGGAVTTSDATVADRVRLLRNYGSRVKYHNEVRGFNSRLDPLQCAFLSAKLPVLPEWNARRVAIAKRYSDAFTGVPGLVTPQPGQDGEHAWHLYVVQHERRDALQAYLNENGIGTLIHYPIPPHLSEAYEDFGYKPGAFPIAESMAKRVLSLPIGPHLKDDEADYVIDRVIAFTRS